MSREIKFRALKEDSNDFIYGFLSSPDTIAIKSGDDYDDIPIEIETIGQYIGESDKYGTAIYTGDLVSFGDELYDEDGMPDIKEVIYDDEKCAYVIYDYMNLQGSSLAEIFSLDDVIEQIEVIGNVYQNPELLDYRKQ